MIIANDITTKNMNSLVKELRELLQVNNVCFEEVKEYSDYVFYIPSKNEAYCSLRIKFDENIIYACSRCLLTANSSIEALRKDAAIALAVDCYKALTAELK